MLHAVIMAGGSGTRFWPRSTKAHPKQFLNLFGDRTMLQTTVDRIRPIIPDERVWVITNDRYTDLVAEQLPDVPKSNIVGEPVAKNTAPCVALAAALLHRQDPEATMVVLPADHQITQPERFRSIIQTAAAKAEQQEALVTIGIEPTRPETGYGYIEYDQKSGETLKENEVKKVKQFREKPDEDTARSFINSGNFLWNSGMFIWQASTILRQFEQHQPKIFEQVETFESLLSNGSQKQAVDTFYHGCPSISIDYGIMEHAHTVFVVPGAFGWSDVGSWRAVYDLREKDNRGNVIRANHSVLEASGNNLIHSESGKVVALVGVDNLAVVETADAILVCNLNEAQGVKQIVESLKKSEETKKFL